MTKGEIFEIKPFAIHDGDGIRTTVFFKGCPLRCKWCHNPEGLKRGPQLAFYANHCINCGRCAKVCPTGAHIQGENGHIFRREKCVACGMCIPVCRNALRLYGYSVSVDELLPKLFEDKVFYDSSRGGVTLSGGEPLLQIDFVEKLLCRLKEEGVSTAVDTCGDVDKSAFERVLPYTDMFLFDLKAVDSNVHEYCTGRGNARILDNLAFLVNSGAKIEIRIPLVPEYNDEQIPKMKALLKEIGNIEKIKVLPYHEFVQSKYDALGYKYLAVDAKSPSAEKLKEVKSFFEDMNLEKKD